MKTKTLNKRFLVPICLFLIIIACLLIIMPEKYMASTKDGILLWATCVLPATFPFLFITALLTRLNAVGTISRLLSPLTKKVFCQSGISAYILLTSMLSGYPVGAKMLSDLRESGLISPSQAAKMSLLCSTSGPLFMVGSVGMNLFHSMKAGVFLLISNYLSVFLTAIALRKIPANESDKQRNFSLRIDGILYDCMYSSVVSVLCVGGFVAVFYTLSQMLWDCKILAPLSFLLERIPALTGTGEGIAKGLIEMTGGCALLSASDSPLALPLCALLVTIGGVSILLQQIAYLKKSKIPCKVFVLSKIIQGIFSFIICFFLSICA